MRASLVASSGQDPRFGELHDALVDALALAGVEASVSVDCLAADDGDLVHVLVPGAYLPHVHPAAYPSPDQLKRTVLIVTESPGDPGFDEAAALAESAAVTFVLDPLALPSARVLRLGHVPNWSVAQSEERPVDVALIADFSDRRAQALSHLAPVLAEHRTALHLLRRPLTTLEREATPSRFELLARTRVLLAVHRGEARGFDWLTALPAMNNGCVVLSEPAEAHGPLVAGKHFDCAAFEALPTALEGLLGSPDRISNIASEAYELLKAERPLEAVGAALAEAIEQASRSAGRPGARARIATPMPLPPQLPRPGVERLQAGPDGDDLVRAALKQALLRQRGLERDLRRLESPDEPRREDRVIELGPDREASASDRAVPRVSVVVTLYNYAHTIAAAIRSVALQELDDVELVLVDDASTDESLGVARATIAELPWLRGRIVERGQNGGLASARNLGIEHARADYVFVLDADNEIAPRGLSLLADALDADPDATFAYGLIQTVGPAGPLGLLSWAAWDPDWLRVDNYIDAMAMLRRDAVLGVGGYSSEESLYGWEDFDLWCNMASRGMAGTRVPEIVATYRSGGQSMISLTTLDSTDGWTTLVDRYEFLR